jgi:uncharacterized protein (DUF433 family)
MDKHESQIKNISGYAWIVQSPDLLGGQPTIKGTRLSVAFVLESLAVGYTPLELAADYPGFPPESVPDVLRYAAEFLTKSA